MLRQIENQLSDRPDIVKLHFNAWTADGENALEGLIKAVLAKLDPNVLRRTIRKVTQDRRIKIVARLGLGLVARFSGATRLVDELWKQMAIDAKSRNELRDLIHDMLSAWVSPRGTPNLSRALVVFIDDLDRCSDNVVVKVCEAVKLYLDAPGLIFVIACDQSVLARGVSAAVQGGSSGGRAYLEKIVQVAYRMPPPDDTKLRRLIHEYARASGTDDLIDETVERILADGTGRNPRRIKRIINSFVLEYRLDAAWRQLGSTQLVTAILLQHVYPPFYELLVNEDSGEDPVGEFLDYVEVRDKAHDPPADADPWWTTVRRAFNAHRLAAPERSDMDREKLASKVADLERELPECFPVLARYGAFVALLRGVGDADARHALQAQLLRRPLATASVREAPQTASGEPLAGWRIVCIDDNPESLSALVQMLEQRGAAVKVFSSPTASDQEIKRRKPDAVISDIARGADSTAGFSHISRLRNAGYDGPVVFFTGRVTP